MKKYRVHTDDEDFEVEELDEETEGESVTNAEVTDDELSSEEIAALKQLAAIAPKLVEMCNGTADCGEGTEEVVDEDEELEDAEEEEKEEVVETQKGHDSKKSFGSIENHKKQADSVETDEVSDAWAKRFGGKR